MVLLITSVISARSHTTLHISIRWQIVKSMFKIIELNSFLPYFVVKPRIVIAKSYINIKMLLLEIYTHLNNVDYFHEN